MPDCGCGIQGRPLHLGKQFFKSRWRLDGATGFRERHFFTSIGRLVCRAQGAAFSLKGIISQNKLATVLQLSHKKDERRAAFGG